MKRRLIVCCLPLLLSGCAYFSDLPMYSDYQRITVGQPPPADIHKNPDWGTRTRITWPDATGVTEEARYLVGPDGTVTAKWYRGGGEKGTLLLMWYQRRDRTGGCVLIPDDKADRDRDALDALRATYKELWSTPPDKRVTEALRIAEQRGRLSSPGFSATEVKTKSVFPLYDRTEWKTRRCKCDGIEMTVDDRKDISLIVGTLLGWIGFLTGNPP